jgi:hypothetical protein
LDSSGYSRRELSGELTDVAVLLVGMPFWSALSAFVPDGNSAWAPALSVVTEVEGPNSLAVEVVRRELGAKVRTCLCALKAVEVCAGKRRI